MDKRLCSLHGLTQYYFRDKIQVKHTSKDAKHCEGQALHAMHNRNSITYLAVPEHGALPMVYYAVNSLVSLWGFSSKKLVQGLTSVVLDYDYSTI